MYIKIIKKRIKSNGKVYLKDTKCNLIKDLAEKWIKAGYATEWVEEPAPVLATAPKKKGI